MYRISIMHIIRVLSGVIEARSHVRNDPPRVDSNGFCVGTFQWKHYSLQKKIARRLSEDYALWCQNQSRKITSHLITVA
ncbi:hypothetical protein TNCV_1540721 [Trichonephila clavipes]|nr:hypothetical protein TNCV_1540721 [Trichonephila clavipes]